MENNKNIYWKIAEARAELQKVELKKSGHNKFSNYKYYELSDFLPVINKINAQLGIFSMVDIDAETACLTAINCDNPEEKVEFKIPSTSIEMKGANTVQMIGAVQTYLRRYLYVNFYEISENDEIDSTEASENRAGKTSKTKPTKTDQKVVVEKEENIKELVLDKTKELNLEDTKKEVVSLCRSISQNGKRDKVTEIMKAHNNGNINPNSITELSIAQKVLEELNSIQ